MKPKVIGAELAFESIDGKHLICPKCLKNFKFIGPSRSVQCPQCKAQGFWFPDNVVTCPVCRTKGQCIVVDGVHWKVWVPLPPDVMAKFEESI